jgi:hypothetical protein
MSPMKGPSFFSPDVQGTFRKSPFKYPAETDRYLEPFDGAGERKIAGEASTSYLISGAAIRGDADRRAGRRPPAGFNERS